MKNRLLIKLFFDDLRDFSYDRTQLSSSHIANLDSNEVVDDYYLFKEEYNWQSYQFIFETVFQNSESSGNFRLDWIECFG